MYKVWYWAMIDRVRADQFVASIPDLEGRAVVGQTEKDALIHLTELAARRVRAAVEGRELVPERRQFTEMPSLIRTKEVGRAIIPVVQRREAWPLPRPIRRHLWAPGIDI